MSRRAEADRMLAASLARRAYHAAAREDWPAANEAMAEIGRQSPNVIALALMAWCDTAIGIQMRAAGRAMPEAGAVVELLWSEEGGPVHADADAVPAAARWAGRLMAARAAMDIDGFQALLKALPRDGFERGRYASAVLMNCVKAAGLPAGNGAAS